MANELIFFLGAIVGDIYNGGEFTNLRFDSKTLDEFKKAAKLYNEKNYEACIQTIWRLFELFLKQLFHIPERDKVNITDLIHRAGKEEVLTETEIELTLALYRLRSVSEHGHLQKNEILIAKGLLVAGIPLLSNLMRSRKVKSVKLEELGQLPDEEAIQPYLKAQSTGALLVLLGDVFEQLSLIHDYEQLSAVRNLIMAIKYASSSRDNEVDKLRIFDCIQGHLLKLGKTMVVIEQVYGAIRCALDDLAIKEHALTSGFVDQYIRDLENATSFSDAKTRAQIIALFANKLKKAQKLRIVSSITKNIQVLESFGTRAALGPIVESIREEIPRAQRKILSENKFLAR